MEHVPVLKDQILDNLKEWGRTPEIFLDGTFGRGGHTEAIRELFPNLKIVAMDQDADAIAYGKEKFPNIEFVHCNFEQFKERFGPESFDLILLDLGVSSPQLDQAERGFSFYHDGPLDMRMNTAEGDTAADIVNTWDEESLIELFQKLGEIRKPTRTVKNIIEHRREKPFAKTVELASVIEKSEGWRRRGHHPATKYFLALRLKVNRELEVIENVIEDMICGLKPGGRLYIITFHSLEDRIVKYRFKDLLNYGALVNKKVIQPKWEETKKNPRARSAKLRIFEKGAANVETSNE